MIEGKYEKRMESLRHRMDLKNKIEVAETEARKNQRISEIIEDHNNAFNNLKEHYNDITVNNLTLIGSLKVSYKNMCLIHFMLMIIKIQNMYTPVFVSRKSYWN